MAANYLVELGYLSKTHSNEQNSVSKQQLKDAIKSFQQSNRIPVTGVIDDNSCKLLNRPQCGGMILPNALSDYKHRSRRFASFELKWPRTNLTWRLINENMTNLDENWAREILQQALEVWSHETPLNFREVDAKRVDIEIGFSRDLQALFNTTQRILGYANPPNPIKVLLRFDADQNWASSSDDNDYSTADLMYTAVHELGHALGLDHSNVEDAIMYPAYKIVFKGLHEDDRKGIQNLYGPRGKDRNKKARMLRAMKGVRNNIRWKMLAISEPIKKFFRYVF
ncbi:matrix metalloproteinase-2-like [Contarinia nasturtii]|uniref:matrix metalloproteinase-2-like n=1 Tax=Contarinia nasturtii TaxID=265458 RepID=UPI0012D3931F|nr:matrix metalloproteinase-2-like [Contarinia nasturtii]